MSLSTVTARAKYLRTSPRKLNLVAQMIRGKKVEKALSALSNCPRRISDQVYKILQSAIANAENNNGLDVDSLVVDEAYVGKAFTMKRFQACAKGRAGKIQKPFSKITIILRENRE